MHLLKINRNDVFTTQNMTYAYLDEFNFNDIMHELILDEDYKKITSFEFLLGENDLSVLLRFTPTKKFTTDINNKLEGSETFTLVNASKTINKIYFLDHIWFSTRAELICFLNAILELDLNAYQKISAIRFEKKNKIILGVDEAFLNFLPSLERKRA